LLQETRKTEKNNEIKQRIEKLRLEQKRTVALGSKEYREKSKQAAIDWVGDWDVELDLACCWHASDFLRDQQGGRDETWLQRQLSTYFNKLIKRVHDHMPVKMRPNIARLITLEHTDGVGWHAHGVVATPGHMTSDEFSLILRDLWIEQMGGCHFAPMGKRIFWCEQSGSGYLPYMLKSATDKNGHRYGELKGLIDVHNTRRP
jgi:hypothetical protein